MSHLVCDSKKMKMISWYGMFSFSLISNNTVGINCECGHCFEKTLDCNTLVRCKNCGCLWDVEQTQLSITLTQPRTNLGLIFSKSDEFLKAVDLENKERREKDLAMVSNIHHKSKICKILKNIEKSGISHSEIIKALNAT